MRLSSGFPLHAGSANRRSRGCGATAERPAAMLASSAASLPDRAATAPGRLASRNPQTWPGNNLNNPGVSGEIYSLVVLTNDETMVVGNYLSYNGVAQNNLTLINKDGSLDASFNPGLGADAAINAVAVANGNQFVIGGAFTAFNGNGCGLIARLNANGSLDFPFSTGQGSGADATVRAVAMQADGKVLIRGDFTPVHGG